MNDKLTNKKIEKLKKQWEKDIKTIQDIEKYPSTGGRLDNGNGGEYTKITEKFRKLINDLKYK